MEKLDKMFTMLSSIKFTFVDNIDLFVCILCNDILKNACQTISGCNFCENCLNKYISSGGAICPGNSADCKIDNLSNFSINNRVNFKISKLIVKCPNEICSKQLQLIDIEEHLRFCSNDFIKCPYYDLGCNDDNFECKQLEDHMQSENLCHNKIVADVILHLKNEVVELKQYRKQVNSEMEIIKENEKIVEEQIKTLEIENRNLKKLLFIYESNRNSYDENCNSKSRNNSIESASDDLKLLSLVSNQSNNSQQINLEDAFNIQLEAKIIDMKQNWKRKLEESLDGKLLANKIEIEKTINDLERRLIFKDEIFEWEINKILEINKHENIASDFFYQRMNPYKLRLKLKNSTNFLWIRLRVYSGLSDSNRKWPFHADVSIKISNKHCPDACRIITQSCKINKPTIFSYKSSDRFTFYYSDLASVNLLNDTECIVECFVKFE